MENKNQNQKEKDYRDARLNGYGGSYQQFVSSYFNDTGAVEQTNTTMNMASSDNGSSPNTIVREMLPLREPSKPSKSEEETILGLKPIYFYGACAAVVVLTIALGILIWKSMKKPVVVGETVAPATAAPVTPAPASDKK